MFELLTANGDGAAWDRAVSFMTLELQDTQVQRGWVAAHQGPGVTAMLAVHTDGKRGTQTIQPFLLRNISGTPFYDIAAAGHGGPFTSNIMPSRRDGEAFAEAFAAALKPLKVVSEVWMANPVFSQQQALLTDGGAYRYERAASIVPLGTPDMQLRMMKPNRRQSLQRGKEAVFDTCPPAEFITLYAAAMERKHAAQRWQMTVADIERLAAAPGALLLKATVPGAASPAAVAMFMLGRAAVYYHLAATVSPPLHGYADALIYEAMGWAWARGVPFMYLGGGLGDEDSLSAYKRSWGGLLRPVYSYRKVHQLDVYTALGGPRQTSFFPAYRAQEAQPS